MQVSHQNGIEEKEENPIGNLLQKYMPYWWLFAALICLCLAGAWCYLKYVTPLYESSATLLVKDEKKGVDDSNLMEQLDLFGSKKLVENEIEVIKSRTLMEEVVTGLSLYAPISSQARFKNISAYINSPVIIEAQNPMGILREKKVLFTYDSAKAQVILNGKAHPLNQWFSDSLNTIRFLPNPRYVRPEVTRPLFYTMSGVQEVADGYLGGLKVAQATKLSSVINISLRDAIPERSEDVLNGLIAAYNKAAISDKNAQAVNTLRFINARLALVANALDSVELGIQKYKVREGITDVSAQGQHYLDNVGVNDAQLSKINVQLAVMDQIESYVTAKGNQTGIVPSTFGVEDAGLSTLLGKLYDLEIQYEGLSKTTAENNPLLLGIRNEIDKIKPNILENVHNLRRNLEAGKANLSGTSDAYSSILRQLPQKEKGLVKISRQQTVMNGIYSFLLQKREETALSYNSAVADTRVVDTAQTGVQPVSPKRQVMYLIAIGLGCVIAVGLIAFKEIFNPNILFRGEIEEYTTVPVIGELSQERSASPFAIGDGRNTVIADQFRQLRASLAYIGINDRKKTLLICSNVSGEGKSFVAANLAISLALANKKVVLVDLDIRRAGVSQLFKMKETDAGMSDYLTGQKDADHIIRRTSNSENLFLIPAGAVPSNPSELILDGRLGELLEYLKTIFDYVIIDSLPVGPVSDGYVISPMCDATLFVVRHGVSPKSAVRMLDKNIRTHNLKNVAIIFNGIKTRGLGRFGMGYGYTSNYLYEYSTKPDRKVRK